MSDASFSDMPSRASGTGWNFDGRLSWTAFFCLHAVMSRAKRNPAEGKEPWRVAVFGDTHDRFPPGLPERLAQANELWHLGDVCEPATLVEFELTGCPLTVVRGNNDWHEAWPPHLRLERRGRVFHLEHIAPRRAPLGVEFMLSGHMHVPSDMTDPAGVRWLNPGCITRPRAQVRSFAWLTIGAEGAVAWETVVL